MDFSRIQRNPFIAPDFLAYCVAVKNKRKNLSKPFSVIGDSNIALWRPTDRDVPVDKPLFV